MQRDALSLLDISNLMRRRFPVFLIVLLVAVSISVYITLTATPIYRAQARLWSEPEEGLLRTADLTYAATRKLYLWEQYNKTQAELFTSSSFCAKVLEKLPPKLKDEFLLSPDPVDALAKSLQVQVGEKSFMLHVSCTGPDPEKITNIVNTACDTFVSHLTEEYRSRQAQRAGIIGETIPKLKEERDKAYQDYLEFLREHDFPDLEYAQKTQKQSMDQITGKLTELELKIVGLKQQHNNLTKLDTTFDKHLLDEPMIKDDRIVQELREKKLRLEEEHEMKAEELGEEHPDYKQSNARIIKVRKKLEDIVLDKVTALKMSCESEIDRAEGELKELENKLAAELTKLTTINELFIKSEELKRRYKSKEELLEHYSRQLGQTAVGQQEMLANVKIIDPAKIPRAPFKPNKFFNITVGTIFGLFLGLLAALYVDYLDNSVKNSEEVEQITDPVPILCEIPLIRSERVSLAEGPTLFTESGEPNAFEAFRKLRVEFLIRAQKSNCKVVSIISSQMSEGKSTVAVNLANSLRHDGRKVLLIDSDFRNPCLLSLFGEEQKGDLIEFFKDTNVKPEQLILEVAGFGLLGLSMPLASSTEIIGSKRFDELLTWARSNYEYVVIDSPPVLLTADSAVIAQKSDCVILVTRQYQTRRVDLKAVKKQLVGAGVNILGCVFNCVDKFSSKYYSYYYNYGAKKRRRKGAQVSTESSGERSVYALGPVEQLITELQRLKILVASSNEDSRKDIMKRMHEANVEFKEARNGKQAVDLATSWVPDLILLDLELQGGFEIIREIRKSPQLIKTVVVTFTKGAIEDARKMSTASGADAFIEKLEDIPALDEIVRQMLERVSRRRGSDQIN